MNARKPLIIATMSTLILASVLRFAPVSAATKIPLTVEINMLSVSYDYDGQPHLYPADFYLGRRKIDGCVEHTYDECSDYNYTKDYVKLTTDPLYATDAGNYIAPITPANFENTNPNYSVTFKIFMSGSINIDKGRADVYLTGATAEYDYDGTPHSVSGITLDRIETTSPAPDFTEDDIDITEAENRTLYAAEVGEYPLEFDEESDFTVKNANYNVFYHITPGKLTIKPKNPSPDVFLPTPVIPKAPNTGTVSTS